MFLFSLTAVWFFFFFVAQVSLDFMILLGAGINSFT